MTNYKTTNEVHEYKRQLLASIDKMEKDVQASRSWYNAVRQDLEEEAFFSGFGGDSWEAEQATEGVRIANTMLDLLAKLRKEFDELT